MEARERLVQAMREKRRELIGLRVDRIYFDLFMAGLRSLVGAPAALALMDGEGVVFPKKADRKVMLTIAKFVREQAIPSPTDYDPDAIYFNNLLARELFSAMLDTSPYKENPDGN